MLILIPALLFSYCRFMWASFVQTRSRVVVFDDFISGVQLSGHTITASRVHGRLECAILCRSEVRCQSYNYCEERLCELNNVTISDVTADHVTNNSQCEYRGTPNDCEKVDPSLERCSGCVKTMADFQWTRWNGTVTVVETSPIEWTIAKERVCRNVTQNQQILPNSYCKGCSVDPAEYLIWLQDYKTWEDARDYCVSINLTLWGRIDGTEIAVMQNFPFIAVNEFFWIGAYKEDNTGIFLTTRVYKPEFKKSFQS
ncbi:uncharacterized protein LOC142335827 [Convolutriloba macropyga]|uniref:uncharacterized protein LOC142335827 n=1 Tax=Convolutriloba macropyga TaxID=536237 RepID=UPI003F51B820